MNRGGTQSFFFRIRGPMMVLLAIILLVAIALGVAKSRGQVSYSPVTAAKACGIGSASGCIDSYTGSSCGAGLTCQDSGIKGTDGLAACVCAPEPKPIKLLCPKGVGASSCQGKEYGSSCNEGKGHCLWAEPEHRFGCTCQSS